MAAHPAAAGLFGKRAVSVADIHGEIRPMTITAPDGRTRAIARFSNFSSDDPEDGHLSVFLGGDDHDFPGGPDAELLWAPDSNAIAVTADTGGDDGRFETSIMVRPDRGRHWHEMSITDRVAARFAPRMICEDDEAPHVGAVGWTSGRRLIVAAQVPRHSSCLHRGSFAAYIVDVPSGDVLMELDQRLIRTRYRHMLGKTLMPGRSISHRRMRRR